MRGDRKDYKWDEGERKPLAQIHIVSAQRKLGIPGEM